MAPLTAVSPRAMITPQFLAKHQNADAKYSSIILHLRTAQPGQLKAAITKRYRLLNDSILVTRKHSKLPFDAPGNLRIVCTAQMTLIILSLLHIMGGHYGINTLARLFAQTYKSPDSLLGYAKLVALGCRACRFHRPTHRRVVPPGRVPWAPFPNHTWHMDHMVFKREQHWGGRKIDAALNILDLFSNLLISHLVPNQKHTTTIRCLKETFSTFPAPFKIVSDNSTSLCANKDVIAFLKSKGVQTVTTITAYNSKANKSERIHKTLRETMKLVQETFHRKSPFDMFYTVLEMLNNRPLSITLHPYIRALLGGRTEIATPFSLHYGIKPPQHPKIPMEDLLSPEDQETYRQKWIRILQEYDRNLQKDLDERNKNFKPKDPIQAGDLVLIQNKTAHKEDLKYYRNIYEVSKIHEAKYYCSPLFKGQRLMAVKGDFLKPYSHTHLFGLLPPNIRELMGESLTPDELKKQSFQEPQKVPKDFQDWPLLQLPKPMKLRRRLAPNSLTSEPAISLSNTNTVSHWADDSGSEKSKSDSGTLSFFSGISGDTFEIKKDGPPRPLIQVPGGSILSVRTLDSVSVTPGLTEKKEKKTAEQSSSKHEAPALTATGSKIVQVPRRVIPLLPQVPRIIHFVKQKKAPVIIPFAKRPQPPPGELPGPEANRNVTPSSSSLSSSGGSRHGSSSETEIHHSRSPPPRTEGPGTEKSISPARSEANVSQSSSEGPQESVSPPSSTKTNNSHPSEEIVSSPQESPQRSPQDSGTEDQDTRSETSSGSGSETHTDSSETEDRKQSSDEKDEKDDSRQTTESDESRTEADQKQEETSSDETTSPDEEVSEKESAQEEENQQDQQGTPPQTPPSSDEEAHHSEEEEQQSPDRPSSSPTGGRKTRSPRSPPPVLSSEEISSSESEKEKENPRQKQKEETKTKQKEKQTSTESENEEDEEFGTPREETQTFQTPASSPQKSTKKKESKPEEKILTPPLQDKSLQTSLISSPEEMEKQKEMEEISNQRKADRKEAGSQATKDLTKVFEEIYKQEKEERRLEKEKQAEQSKLLGEQQTAKAFSRAGRPLRMSSRLGDFWTKQKKEKPKQQRTKASETQETKEEKQQEMKEKSPISQQVEAMRREIQDFYQDDNLGLPSPPPKRKPEQQSPEFSGEESLSEKDLVGSASPSQEHQEILQSPVLSPIPPPRPFTPDVLIIDHGTPAGKAHKSILKKKEFKQQQDDTPDLVQVVEKEKSFMDLPSSKQEEKQEEEMDVSQQEEIETQNVQPLRKDEQEEQEQIQDDVDMEGDFLNRREQQTRISPEKRKEGGIEVEKRKEERPLKGPFKIFKISPPSSFYIPSVLPSQVPVSVEAMIQPPQTTETHSGRWSQREIQEDPQSSFLSQRLPTVNLPQQVKAWEPPPSQEKPFPYLDRFTPSPVEMISNLDLQREAASYHPAVRPIRRHFDPSLLDTLLPPMGSLRNVPIPPLTPSPPLSAHASPPTMSPEKGVEEGLKQQQEQNLTPELADQVEGVKRTQSLSKELREKEKEDLVASPTGPDVLDQKLEKEEKVEKEKSKHSQEEFARTKPVKRPEPPSPGVPSMSSRREQMIHPQVKRHDDHPSPVSKSKTLEKEKPNPSQPTLEDGDQDMGVLAQQNPQKQETPVLQQKQGEKEQETLQMDQDGEKGATKRQHPPSPLKQAEAPVGFPTPQAVAPPAKKPMAFEEQNQEKPEEKMEEKTEKKEKTEPFSQKQHQGSRHSSRQSQPPSRLEYKSDFVQTSTGRQTRNKPPTGPPVQPADEAMPAPAPATKQTKQPVKRKEQPKPEQETSERPKRKTKVPDRLGY